jgi:hypothetical protein
MILRTLLTSWTSSNKETRNNNTRRHDIEAARLDSPGTHKSALLDAAPLEGVRFSQSTLERQRAGKVHNRGQADAPDGAMGEGIAIDSAGNLFTAEATVRGVTKYVKD